MLLTIHPLDVGRARAMLTAIESTLPTPALSFAMVDPSGPKPVDDPASWLVSQLSLDDLEKWGGLCSADENAFVSVTVQLLETRGAPLFDVKVGFPWKPPFVDRVPDLMCALGPVTQAIHGDAAPTSVGAQLARGLGRKAPKPPSMQIPQRPLLIPIRISWLNYWSRATCDALKFAPGDPRAAVFDRVIPAGDHGVVLQLTRDVLDLDRPEHVAAVTAAYDAFPVIDFNR